MQKYCSIVLARVNPCGAISSQSPLFFTIKLDSSVIHSGHKVLHKEILGVFQSHKLSFPYVNVTESKCNNDLHKGHSSSTAAITRHHRSLSMSEINNACVYAVNICCTQIFETQSKTTVCVIFFRDVSQNSPILPGSEKSHSFPDLWLPCHCYDGKITLQMTCTEFKMHTDLVLCHLLL